jgi:hypothetical protein
VPVPEGRAAVGCWGWWCVHGRYAVPSTSRNLHEGICVKCTKMKIVKSCCLTGVPSETVKLCVCVWCGVVHVYHKLYDHGSTDHSPKING